MKKTSFITGILGTALLLIPLSLFAQDDERASLSDVWYVMPKAGMVAEFEAAMREHIAFRRDAGESRNWQAYSVALGGNPMLYQWRAGGLEWADQDAYAAEDQEKGLGENFFANVDQYVDHYHHYMEKADYANSKWPADMEQHPYYAVTSWTLKMGAGPGSSEARKKLSQIGIENDWEGNWLWLNRIGGTPTLGLVSELDNMADMEPPEQSYLEFVTEILGSEEEAGALFAQFSAGLADSSFTVWAHRPDLSSQETAATDD